MRAKRPLIQHEASILRSLRGHPSIPEILGYSRIEHFELLSMPLFHKSVGDIGKNETPIPLPELLRIADQMVSRNHDFNFASIY